MNTQDQAKVPESITLSTGQKQPAQTTQVPWIQYASIGLSLTIVIAAITALIAWRKATQRLLADPRAVYVRAMTRFQTQS